MKDNTVFLVAANIYAGYLAAEGRYADERNKSQREGYMNKATADAMLLIGKIENRYTAEELKVVEK